jgi:serine/threonine protein kinase
MHQHCHLAHLDIKLENLVLDAPYYHVKLIDFAFCEPVDTLLTEARGTPQYLAPEVLLAAENDKSITKP